MGRCAVVSSLHPKTTERALRWCPNRDVVTQNEQTRFRTMSSSVGIR